MENRVDLADICLADAARNEHGFPDRSDFALRPLPVEARSRAAGRTLLVGIDEDHRGRIGIGRLCRKAVAVAVGLDDGLLDALSIRCILMAMQLDQVQVAQPCDIIDDARLLIDEDADRLDMRHSLANAGGLLRVDEAMAAAPEDEADKIRPRLFRRAGRLHRLHAT